MADLTKGYSFTSNEELTNDKLNTLVDSATIADIDQSDLAANHGLVVRSGTAPSDTDALWFDTSVNKLKIYAGSSWNQVLDTSIVKNTADTGADCLGHLEGCWISRKDKDELYISPGRVAIGNGLYKEAATITVDISAAWAAAGTTGGYDSGIATNAQQDDTWYYVYLTTTTGDVDGYQVLLDNITNVTPTDVTLGTDARLIGMYYHLNVGTGIQMIHNFRPDCVHGWNYVTGDDAGGVTVADLSYGVTFVFPPIVVTTQAGFVEVATVPVGVDTFTSSEYQVAAVYDVGVSDCSFNIWITDAATNSIYKYGYTFVAYGQWGV